MTEERFNKTWKVIERMATKDDLSIHEIALLSNFLAEAKKKMVDKEPDKSKVKTFQDDYGHRYH